MPGGASRPYRKLHVAPPEQGLLPAGNTIPVFKTPKVPLGVQICYDAPVPELTPRMALDGT
ncbi:MAG: nitrilase, partial [Desulfosarcina sp.]|nr:nitrilase [Desulfobacterales bacterium]